jgi:RNA polymerase sigma factor (sigma-70 family)
MNGRSEPPAGAPGPARPDQLESTAQLLERYRSGDQAALNILFARYLTPLSRWARGRLPQWARDARDTQDLVQDSLLKTFKRIDLLEYRREGALQAYLRQALLNDIRYEIRRLGRRAVPTPLDSRRPDECPSPLDQAVGQQAVERYEQALASLRAEDREAIIGRVEMGQSYQQLAEMLGKPSAEAARQSARRALLRLAAAMKVP